MRNFVPHISRFVPLMLACVFGVSAFGQTPKPTPPDDVVKINTTVIQLDVAVTDSKGKPVGDLKPDEIEIYENGQKQKITAMRFVSSVRDPTPPQPKASPGVTDVPVPTGPVKAENVRRTIALVVDDLALSFESAYYTRRALKKFVDEQMQDGDLVAIIRTGAGIGALQQFTSDKRILLAAIERVKWNPVGGSGIGAFAPIEPTPLENLAAAGGDISEEELDAERKSINSINDYRGSIFATGTLGALRYIVNGMSELPGRKSVILLSEGFRLTERDEDGFETSGGVMDFLRRLIDEANRHSVVFYTVDPRGLQTAGIDAADNTNGLNAQALEQRSADRRDQLIETQAGLDVLSKGTGGFSIKNNNDLPGGIRRVLDDQSYYLVAYEPDDETFDAAKRKFNKIEVKVLRPGLSARYRNGFFNVADRPDPNKATAKITPVQELETALVSPFAVGGITLRLNTLFANDAKIGTFVRSLLHIDASDLTFIDAGAGQKKAEFDVIAMAFGDNGQPVDKVGKSYTLTVKTENLKRLVDNGFVYTFGFPVKKAGPYQYRVALRDSNSGKTGSASQFVEVPDIRKGRLTISGVVLEGMSEDQWRDSTQMPATDPMTDTALRRVKAGSVIRYGYEIYNARHDSAKPNVSVRVRIFRDGKLVLDGKPAAVLSTQTDQDRLKADGAFALGKTLQAGDYILQIIATDANAPAKKQIATQVVQFEVVQ